MQQFPCLFAAGQGFVISPVWLQAAYNRFIQPAGVKPVTFLFDLVGGAAAFGGSCQSGVNEVMSQGKTLGVCP